jgi:uncharacterized membrane protein
MRAKEIMPVFDSEAVESRADFRYFKRHFSSFDRRLLMLSFVALGVAALLPAIAFLLAGAWLVLPFAGLEIGVLAAVFHAVVLRSGCCEAVSITGDRVLCDVAGRRVEFHRYWVRMRTRPDGLVCLRSHGREVHLGRFSGEEDRRALAVALSSRLNRM